MAHLHCHDHNRRVAVLDRYTIHRSDGSKCQSLSLNIDGRWLTSAQVRDHVRKYGYIPPAPINL